MSEAPQARQLWQMRRFLHRMDRVPLNPDTIDRDILDTRILPYVTTPAQYIGGEVNQVVKDPSAVALRWALCYPDTYALGMSHHGDRKSVV